MRAGHVRIMPEISAEATIGILTVFKPEDNFLYFRLGELMIESSETGQRPIATCDFKMFS